MKNKSLLLEENKYIEQYHNAIFKLMDKSDISIYEYPVVNLIHQTIENELKYLIAESNYNEKTYKDLGINNSHDLSGLIEREELKKYYDGIKEFEKIFEEYKEKVVYFDKVLGKDTFLNSRYSILPKDNQKTVKVKINYDDFYSNWTRYSELYRYMIFMYVAYSFSNTILYFMKQGKKEDEIEFMQYGMVDELKDELEETECALIYLWISKFVKRNKYYDEKYIN